MPHQCVRCNSFFEDGAEEILKGCSCGGRLFFYIKKSKLEDLQNAEKELHISAEDKKQIENDVLEIVGHREDDDQPVVLDFESIRVKKPGKYELDIVQLFKGNPLIFKLDEGKYIIDLVQTFDNLNKVKIDPNKNKKTKKSKKK